MLNFYGKQGILAVLILSLCASGSWAANTGDATCKNTLQHMTPEDANFAVRHARERGRAERYELKTFISRDRDFVTKHPFNWASAAQLYYSLILSQGTTEVMTPLAPSGRQTAFHAFTQGSPVTGGYRVIGQWPQMNALVNKLRARALGLTSGVYPVLLYGPPGTAKTLSLEIFKRLDENLSMTESPFAQHTFAWKNLHEIPALQRFLPKNEDLTHHEEPATMQESPLVLLPAEVQRQVLERATPVLREFTQEPTLRPLPKMDANPQDAFYRDTIWDHYLAQKREHMRAQGASSDQLTDAELTTEEKLDALNRHVVVTRLVVNDQMFSIVPAQARDVNYGQLFFQPNFMVAGKVGAGHPLSVFYRGAFPRANRGMLALDEVLKNPQHLLAKLLTMIQSGVISEAGVSVPVDMVVILATNTKELNELKEKDPHSPLVSRLTLEDMPWLIEPQLVAKAHAQELQGLNMISLASPTEGPRDARQHLDELFPHAKPGDLGVQWPDHHYNLEVNGVHVSPQALAFMAQWETLTRLNFDENKVQGFARFPLEVQSVYRNEEARLRALMNPHQLQDSVRSTLAKVSKMTQEGHTGFDHRKGTDLLSRALDEARRQGAQHGHACMTPALIKNVIQALAIGNKLSDSVEERQQWLNYADLVFNNFTLPQFRSDIHEALSGPENTARDEIYQEIVSELMAIANSQSDFEKGGVRRPVDRRRLAEVSEIYKRLSQHDLNWQEIANYMGIIQSSLPAGTTTIDISKTRNAHLLDAISQWQGQKSADYIASNLGRIIAVAANQGTSNASDEERIKAQGLIDVMVHKYGYCPHCARQALALVFQHMNNQTQNQR